MKVKIGPHVNWIGPYQIADKIFFWTDAHTWDEDLENRWDYKLRDKFGRLLDKTFLKDLCQWIHDKKKRSVKIKIDNYDTWSADHTLALIILPLLKQLQATKHGSPNVDDDDVPEELKSTSASSKEDEHDTDDNYHQRWDWVLDEMIWAFEQHVDNDADSQFHTGKHEILWRKVTKDGKVLDETLYSFDQKVEDSDDNTYYEMVIGPNDTHVFDKKGWEAWNARKQNGFRLFGKYFQALWD